MVSEKTKGNFGAIVIIFFVIGVFFMIIDDGVGIIAVMWSIAGSAERVTRRF